MRVKCLLVGFVAVALVSVTGAAWGVVLVNGDFEDTSGEFPTGSGWELWPGKPNPVIEHPGLVAGSTTAAMIPSTGGRVVQTFDETSPEWELDFYFASADPGGEGTRSLNLGIRTMDAGAAQINFRVSGLGRIEAHDLALGWTTIAEGVVQYSVDADDSNNYTDDPGDVLNVHRIRFVGHYDDATPNYDVMLSNAGSDDLTDNVYLGLTLLSGASPTLQGDGLIQIAVEGDAATGDYILDNMSLRTIPEPGTLALLAVGGVMFCSRLMRRAGRRGSRA